jgi:cysteine-rich repeat protein
MTARVVLALSVVAACTDAKTVVDPNATGIEVVTQVDASLGVTQIRISDAHETPAFSPGALPNRPRTLSGEQTMVVLLPDSLDGSELVVRLDGLAGDAIVTSGGARVVVQQHHVVRVDVELGAIATCGDGAVSDPIEGCDQGNTMAGDGCSADCYVEPGWRCSNPTSGPSACRPDTFDVIGAASSGHHEIKVTFSDPPDPLAAIDLANYSVPGLTTSGIPFLSGNTVTLATSAQSPIGYNVIVSNITRVSDGHGLTGQVAAFTGRTAFDVMSARSTDATHVAVTFSAPPNPAEATTLANYTIDNGLAVTAAALAGSTVTLTTTTQTSITFMVTVANVTREVDGELLANTTAGFTGVNGFDVASVVSTGNQQIAITFNAPPNLAPATTIGNYSVPGLTLSAPVLAGNTVALTTSPQSVIPYTLTVNATNVTRMGDNVGLTLNTGTFTGMPITPPTVTDVTVIQTVPNNGAIPYNTGTIRVRLTGTQFSSVGCPAGVKLDDLDGIDALVGTPASSCMVDSDTQITALFPAGIRTNGTTGWDVIVTNSAGSNPTSAKLVVQAGLLISEVYIPVVSKHEFVELYNATGTTLDTSTLGLTLHLRDAGGADATKTLSPVAPVAMHTSVTSHNFFLIASQQSGSTDAWFAMRDATYNVASSGLGANGGAYISLSSTANVTVIDKVGWGSQAVHGFEGTALVDIPAGQSAERKPAANLGHATDTDVNAADFNAASTAITPRGIGDGPQP